MRLIWKPLIIFIIILFINHLQVYVYAAIEESDLNIARNNIESKFSLGLIKNPNFIPQNEDKEIARNNTDSLFAANLLLSPNYQIEDVDKEIAQHDPKSNFAEGLTRNKNY